MSVEPLNSKALEFVVSAEMVERFASLTGDRSSLHIDEKFAKRSIYRRPVVHGMLLVSYLLLCRAIARPRYSARIEKIAAKFIGAAYVGDELALVVEAKASSAPQPRAEYDFRIECRRTGEVITRGSATFGYAPPTGTPAPSGPALGSTRHDALASVPMRGLDIGDVAKGLMDGFDIAVTRELAQAFCSMLAAGTRDGGGRAVDTEFDPAQMLALASLSTLVGMRLPGETATFLEFEADCASLAFDTAYRLEGQVAHASRSTGVIKLDVSIVPRRDTAARPVVQGRVAALVNKRGRRTKSIEDLRVSSTDLGLRDKVVVITGASRGIGETTAKLFALFGAKVALNYRRSRSDAERIVAEVFSAGGTALAVQADVSDREQVSAMITAVADRFGGIDVLVNNAVRDFRSIAYQDLDWEEIQADLDVTLKGAFLCSKLVTPHMLRRGGGKIINISSVYADSPPPDQLKYVVSKAALEALARGLAVELADKNIQVNTVVPSFVDTDVASQMHDAIRELKARESPMKRNASPEDVARAVLFLASSFSSYTTGQRILVTGGGAPFL